MRCALSKSDKLDRERELRYREHKIEDTHNGYCCVECNLKAFDDDFPEYCLGPITNVSIGMLETCDAYYNISAKIIHLKNEAILEFHQGAVLSDNFVLNMTPEYIDSLIEKLKQVKAMFK